MRISYSIAINAMDGVDERSVRLSIVLREFDLRHIRICYSHVRGGRNEHYLSINRY